MIINGLIIGELFLKFVDMVYIFLIRLVCLDKKCLR